jgi:hypothetical protein
VALRQGDSSGTLEEGRAKLEAVTRGLMKIQQTKKTVRALVSCIMCELETAPQ